MRRPYLCHITQKDGSYSQQIIYGIVELKKFLRGNRAHFSDSDFSNLEDDSVLIKSPFGTTYEIELLFEPDNKEVDSSTFISIKAYCDKYKYCRQTVYSAIKSGRIRTISLGYKNLVEDKDYKI